MYASVRSAILLTTIISCCASAHEPVVVRSLKYENGWIISWIPVSTDARGSQVNISDEQGTPVVDLNILRMVPDALRVSIYDVSARANLIAVAAVYGSKQGNQKARPRPTLLLFSFGGHLISAFAMEPSHAIARLAVDDQSNIWTLTDHADANVDPSTVPMVVEYTAEGRIAREPLMRNLFPFHATDTRQDINIGAPAMGYDSGVVWFWLPGSTDFVTISTSDGKIAMMKTQLPKRAGRASVPFRMVREPSGSLVAQVGEDDEHGHRVVAHYNWSPATDWVRMKPGKCEGDQLLGASERGQVYRPYQVDRTEICVFPGGD